MIKGFILTDIVFLLVHFLNGYLHPSPHLRCKACGSSCGVCCTVTYDSGSTHSRPLARASVNSNHWTLMSAKHLVVEALTLAARPGVYGTLALHGHASQEQIDSIQLIRYEYLVLYRIKIFRDRRGYTGSMRTREDLIVVIQEPVEV